MGGRKGISFKGLKSGRPDDPVTTYSNALVKTSNKDLDFINGLKENILLFAGTKYHLLAEYYQEN